MVVALVTALAAKINSNSRHLQIQLPIAWQETVTLILPDGTLDIPAADVLP
ncbi:MAG TPA: hypothetical protein VN541_05175 [Tepidisphaeraceae bacterium]|nr:hypothetical protein [Tepidisphaeraceae bacterium]